MTTFQRIAKTLYRSGMKPRLADSYLTVWTGVVLPAHPVSRADRVSDLRQGRTRVEHILGHRPISHRTIIGLEAHRRD